LTEPGAIADNRTTMKRFGENVVVISFIFLVLIFAVPTAPVFAGEAVPKESYAVPSMGKIIEYIAETVDGVEIFHKEGSETNSTVVNVGVNACIWGAGCTDDPNHPFGYKNSALAGVTSAIAFLYGNEPASSYAFAVDMGTSLGFIHPAYAQGTGYKGFLPLLPLWKALRNIAYGVIAIIMIVVGFMVMLRKKIDPKTVVTVQNSIPRIVITLILVAFSYAIVGLMIDLMYLSMLLIMNMLVKAGGLDPSTVGGYLTGGFPKVAGSFFLKGWDAMFDIIALFPWYAQAAAVVIPGLLGGIFSGFQVKGFVLGAAAIPVGYMAIITFALLFGVVRLFFMLLDAYIHIIISLLVAPFQIMIDAVPGANTFEAWFRNLLAKLIVFPTTAGVLVVTQILTSDKIAGQLWAPPLFWDSLSGKGVGGVIGLGMLLAIPAIVAGFQKSLKAEPAIPAGIATIAGPLGSSVGQIFNLYYQWSFIRSASRKHEPGPFQQSTAAGGQGIGNILKGGSDH